MHSGKGKATGPASNRSVRGTFLRASHLAITLNHSKMPMMTLNKLSISDGTAKKSISL